MVDATLVLRRCRLLNHGPSDPDVDIALDGNRIAAIAPQLPITAPEEIEVGGRLVSPPFVESHIHLDSAQTIGQPRWNQSGTLFEGIDIWRDRKQSLTSEDIQERAIATLKLLAQQGTLYVRSHADVSDPSLLTVKGLLAVRAAVKDWITLQVVAFPQDGLYRRPGTEDTLITALELGIDGIGGIPHYEMTREDGVRSVERIFELADRYDKLIDIHCDETDDDQSRFLEVMAACALRHDLGNRVTASHTTAFGSYNNAYAQKLMGLLQKTELNFIANPLINITLQGRGDTYPKRRGVTRVKELWQAGLNVSLGSDCLQDPWYSLGSGNLVEVAAMAVHVCHMTGQAEINACYDMITRHGAQTLNLQDQYGVAVDQPANLIVLDGSDPYDVIRRRPVVRQVISQGKLLVETQPAQTQWQAEV